MKESKKFLDSKGSKKNQIFKNYSIIFWIFIIGSLLGFVHENLLTILKGHYVLRQGLIYEPLIPIYGIGLLVFYLVYYKLEFKKSSKTLQVLIVFMVGFLAGGITEYICSFVQEYFFGTISWDYSKLKYNFNGRTSIFHSFCWGIIGVLVFELLLPKIKKSQNHIMDRQVKIFTIILSVLLLFDCTISILACNRQTERRNNLKPNSALKVFLDKHYPDEYLNRIYNNAKTVKK